jgi:hypothetical protein
MYNLFPGKSGIRINVKQRFTFDNFMAFEFGHRKKRISKNKLLFASGFAVVRRKLYYMNEMEWCSGNNNTAATQETF